MPDIDIPPLEGGSPALRGYLARPAGDGPWPGVVALHEVFGLDDIIRRQADRLAAAGYLTLAPDLFTDGGMRRCVVRTMRSLFAGQGRPLVDIEAARAHLTGLSGCTGRVGVIGFCMGGGFALLSAPRGFAAAAVNYGQLPKDPDAVLAGSCPLVGSYGAKDVSLRGAARQLEGVLERHGVEHDVKEYPSAGHSFLNDRFFGPRVTHPAQRVLHLGPDPAAAPDAWRRIEAFFGQHLREPA